MIDSPPDGRCDTLPVRTTFTEAEAIQIRDALHTATVGSFSAVIRPNHRDMCSELAELAEALRLFDNVGQSFDVVEVAPENVVAWDEEQRRQYQRDEYFGCLNNRAGHELWHLGWECRHCDTHWLEG